MYKQEIKYLSNPSNCTSGMSLETTSGPFTQRYIYDTTKIILLAGKVKLRQNRISTTNHVNAELYFEAKLQGHFSLYPINHIKLTTKQAGSRVMRRSKSYHLLSHRKLSNAKHKHLNCKQCISFVQQL